MYPYRVVLPIITSEGNDAGRLIMVVELPDRPTRGDWITTPGDATPHRVVRTVLHGRLPAGPHGWEPGFKALDASEVELEAMDLSERDALLTAGWKARLALLHVKPPPAAQPASESARALVEGSPVASRRCPAEGCGRALTDRQAACSPKCRAALSRQRRAQARHAKDTEMEGMLDATLRTLVATLRRLRTP
jgi:predicted nucleic acid-binding Zn ribbon protein